GEVKAGALATTDCTSPIRGTSFFADRYSFSGMAGEEVVISTVAAFAPYLVLLDATQTGLAAVAPGGVVARIPATTGTFMLPATGKIGRAACRERAYMSGADEPAHET